VHGPHHGIIDGIAEEPLVEADVGIGVRSHHG